MKESEKEILSNWMTSILNCCGWSCCKNSIGKTVTENWREMAEKNATDLQKMLRKNKVDVVVNADKTFVYLYPKEQAVATPKGVKRVGGNIKSDTKAGFTAMVTRELESINMATPFVVYNGTKLKDAKNKKITLIWKFRNWRNL